MVNMMAIEIKELIIKTNIVHRHSDEGETGVIGVADKQALKEEMLAACRQLLQTMLRERRER